MINPADNGQPVSSVSDIPTSKHWVDLVLANDKSIIIALVLALLGISVFWYSSSNIKALSQPPKAFRTALNLVTENCGSIQPKVHGYGDPDQFGTMLSLYSVRQGETNLPLTDDDCWISRFDVETDWVPERFVEIKPVGERYPPDLIEVTGFPDEQFEHLGQFRNRGDIKGEVVSLGIRNEQAVILTNEGESPTGLSALLRSEEVDYWRSKDKLYTYSLSFTRDWQPESLRFSSRITSTPKTNFSVVATQFNNVENLDELYRSKESYPIDIGLSAWGEEVMMRVGELTPKGQIEGQGHVSFTIDSGTMENIREAGLIQYSTMLGIGVALLTEAFVIFLALLVLEIGRRTWRRKQ